jgi:GNAT superfamily N-acetyltransferase
VAADPPQRIRRRVSSRTIHRIDPIGEPPPAPAVQRMEDMTADATASRWTDAGRTTIDGPDPGGMSAQGTIDVASGNDPAGTALAVRRVTVAPRMSVEISVIRDLAGLHALDAEWRQLVATGGSGALFRSPDWLIPWWHAYHQVLGAELLVLAGREDGELICLAPLYIRTAKIALLDVREVRMLGDAGPRPPALDLLARPGTEDRCGAALARALGEVPGWDVIDLEPLADPSPVRAHMIQRLAAAGYAVESTAAAGGARRIALSLGGAEHATSGLVATFGDDAASLRKGMSVLRRVSRLEWSEREETSPLADEQAAQLLLEVALALAPHGRVRLARCDDSSGVAVAAAVIVDDGDRAVVLAIAVDPQWVGKGAPQKLLAAEATAAAARGRVALDVVTGASEYPLPPLPVSRQTSLAVRAWAPTTTASVSRTYRSVARSARAARATPGAAAAQARAAWARIRNAAGGVAQYQRMQLYRGQLWTRGIEPVPGLEVSLYTLSEFEGDSDAGRAEIAEQLELDENIVRRTFGRGDVAVLARLSGRPAGIAWAARGPVEVPELGRTLQLTKYEAYIHDVYVAAAARGRAVAPVMLERLHHELRQRDAYRSWALIAQDNQASVRAFVKASYTPVCEVIYARLADLDRLMVRPPDAEARELLGLE